MRTWLSGALSQDQGHLLSSFGNQNSNGLIYNMYADKLLGLNLVPTNVSSSVISFEPFLQELIEYLRYPRFSLDFTNHFLAPVSTIWSFFLKNNCAGTYA